MIELTFVDESQAPIELDAETIADAVKMAIEQGISLCGVDLKEADLHTTDLSNADFSDAKLTDVDLRGAKMVGTNFTRAILVNADLMSADLDDAVLSGADLDYACWPLWGCSLYVKIDKRLFCQLLYHTMRLGQSIDDAEVQALLNDLAALSLANQFHHVTEYGKLK